MSLYENIKCPVCNETFKEGDDIVTCPDCGTPHHRECYEKLGKCVNASLHNTEFIFSRESESVAEPEIKKAELTQDEYYVPSENKGEQKATKVCAVCKTEIPADAEICPSCGTAQLNAETSAGHQENNAGTNFKNANDEIDGVKITDVASAIAVNPLKYLVKFKKNKKINWNWSAFIFGPYFFFFRKLYLPGVIITALQLACKLVVFTFYSKELSVVMNGIESAYSAKDRNQIFEAVMQLSQTPEYAKVSLAMTIIFAVTLVLHFICAITADSLYRKKIINIVKNVDEKIENFDSFSISNPFLDIYDKNLSMDEVRKQLLMRQGGVSTFAPLIAFLAVYLITGFMP